MKREPIASSFDTTPLIACVNQTYDSWKNMLDTILEQEVGCIVKEKCRPFKPF